MNQARSFEHQREIKLDKNDAAVRITVVSDQVSLPPHADRLSKDIAASVAQAARKTKSLPDQIILRYPSQHGPDPGANGSQGSDDSRHLIEPLLPRYDLREFICSPEFGALLEDLVFFAQNSRQIRKKMPRVSLTRGILINFFGYSGTGKTMAAEAIARALGKKIHILNYANIESSLLGKTAKNISDAFRSISPQEGIIMLDEADAFVSRRIANLNQGAEYALNAARSQIIREIDRFEGLIILATNLFGTYDSAVLRRIKFNLFFDLPDLDVRVEMYRRFLPQDHTLPDLDPVYLADLSIGLSGGDIQNICEIIFMRALKRFQETGKRLPLSDLEAIIQHYQKKASHQESVKGEVLSGLDPDNTQSDKRSSEPQ